MRADMEHAAAVDRGDAAAAGADALDVDRGEAGHVALIERPDPGLARPRDGAAAHQADVVGGAAGVGDDGGMARRLGQRIVAAGHRRHRRAGVERLDRPLGEFLDIGDAALGGDRRAAGPAKPALAQPAGERRGDSGSSGLQRGVDAARRGAAVLAQRRVELVRQRDRHVRQPLGQDRGDRAARGPD